MAVALRFLRSVPPYNAGEVAGFPPGVAEALVRKGVARLETLPEPDADSAAEPSESPRGRRRAD